MTATGLRRSEQLAIRADAERRLAELEAVRALLLPDRDDLMVLSEIVSIDSQIKAAREALCK
jgi:hypothetical protein